MHSTELALLQPVRVAASCCAVRRASGPSAAIVLFHCVEKCRARQDPLAQVRQRVDGAALEQARVQGCAKAQVAQSARGLDSHRVELGPQRDSRGDRRMLQPAGALSWEVVGLPHAQAAQEQGYCLTVQILAPAASRAAARKVGERGGRLEQQRHRLRRASVASGMKRTPTGDDQRVEASRLYHRILVSLIEVGDWGQG